MAFITLLFVIAGTVFNFITSKRASSKADLERIYDKLDSMKDDYTSKIAETNNEIGKVKTLFYECQIEHSALKNGQSR